MRDVDAFLRRAVQQVDSLLQCRKAYHVIKQRIARARCYGREHGGVFDVDDV